MSFFFYSSLIVLTMPILVSKDRPFKSPRLAKATVVTKDSDEDDTPIAQTLATTQKTHVHRKDNSKWGERMEKQLGDMDRRREETDQTNPTVEIATILETEQTPLLGKRRSVFRRLNTVVDNTEDSDGRLKQGYG